MDPDCCRSGRMQLRRLLSKDGKPTGYWGIGGHYSTPTIVLNFPLPRSERACGFVRGWGTDTHAYPLCHCNPVLDVGVGNLVAVATAVRRRAFSLIEIATWFDRLTMSGCAPRNDRLKRVRPDGSVEAGAGSPAFAPDGRNAARRDCLTITLRRRPGGPSGPPAGPSLPSSWSPDPRGKSGWYWRGTNGRWEYGGRGFGRCIPRR